mmetsp:Transcript_31578/g.101359  ORF Transcript_31578/g.101359 Transcript_31578/m.101359 type:complete len:547 (+) Transcript_31578:177-1817(+)|eukprot:CAMPEP_0118896044 /NCGR_PEP_ID=MMETSP1166-20130328/4103_1 /TAXON_ID=1104430 /ORGANISM="Chrysoreinhardia sp, Strain CCMP3193" /LENGTH=546 /DNA_ID=CAMNT_0006835095 /DNA_START=214 /DNA_END=1854 /DNA_ORIENTATION=+
MRPGPLDDHKGRRVTTGTRLWSGRFTWAVVASCTIALTTSVRLRDNWLVHTGGSGADGLQRLVYVNCESGVPRGADVSKGVRYVMASACASPSELDAGSCIEERADWEGRLRQHMASSPSTAPSLRCLPSFLIVGAQKAATGSLSNWLSTHPSLRRAVGTKTSPRETHFFDTLRNDSDFLERWRFYVNQFPMLSRVEARRGVATYEKSPSYARYPTALQHAAGLVPSAHVVFILRDPIERAYSAFAHHARRRRFCRISNDEGEKKGRLVASCVFSSSVSTSSRSTGDCRVVWFGVDVSRKRYVKHCSSLLPNRDERRSRATISQAVDVLTCLPKCRAKDFDAYTRANTVLAVPNLLLDEPPLAVENHSYPEVWSKTPQFALDVVADGNYYFQIKKILASFHKVHVLLFDELVDDPLGTLDDLQYRLGLPYHDFQAHLTVSKEGRLDLASPVTAAPLRTTLRRQPRGPSHNRQPMLAATRSAMTRFYAPRLDAAFDLLNGQLPQNHRINPPPGWPTLRFDDLASRDDGTIQGVSYDLPPQPNHKQWD